MKTKLALLAVVLFQVFRLFGLEINGSAVTNAEGVASCLLQFRYSDTNISSSAECDFTEREELIFKVLQDGSLCSSTNVLFAIADYVSLGSPIPVENYLNDIIAAHKHDRLVEFGNSNYVVRAGSGYFGPVARTCRQQYEYRRAYNSGLRDFRRFVLKWSFRCLCSPPWSDASAVERNIIWSEFRRRVEATEKEIEGIPLTIE